MKLAIQNQLALKCYQQQQNEKAAALKASERADRNLAELHRSIPNIAKFLADYKLRNHSLFVTKDNQLNILVKSEGIMVYPADAEQHVAKQIATFFHNKYRHLNNDNTNGKCLIIIGIGLGLHILKLVETLKPNYLIIYEPEEDFLKLSLYTAAWFELLTFCNIQNIQIFIQYGPASQDLAGDIQELKQVFRLNKVVFYRHFAYEKLDQALSQLGAQKAIPLETYDMHPFLFPLAEVVVQRGGREPKQQQIFDKNFVFFQEHYPELYTALQETLLQGINSFQNFQTYQNENSIFSDCSSNSLTEENLLILKDPLIFGLTLSKKLNDSAFLKFLNAVNTLIASTVINDNGLEVYFSEIVLLGVLNYEACFQAFKVSNTLVVVEQNLTRFILSCFEIKWFELASTKNIHFLVGENAKLANVEALYQKGNLEFIDSYIFQPYFTKGHREISRDLLETIQSTNGKSNHFEASLKALTRSYQNSTVFPILTRGVLLEQSLPVIVIGNGPSLECALESLKSLRDHFILLSCGTALATLIKNKIRPDYHLELEKETDTLHRLNKLPVKELSCITLIATTETHPAIPLLFKKALLNITSTNPFANLLYEAQQLKPPKLDFSYYTVTNFAVDLLLQLNFKQIYLVGVDFGFPAIDAHHARSSSYFNEKGNSVYDFELRHGATFEVETNLNGTCLTVPAFNTARLLMEKCIAIKTDNTAIYNVGFGAKIKGAQSLQYLPDNFLNSSSASVIDQHYALITTEHTASVVECTLTLAKQFCTSLLILWSTTKAGANSEPEHTLDKLMQQQKLLDKLKISSVEGFELFNGSCRYFSMLCHRYAKTSEAAALMASFTEHWCLLLQHYLTELQLRTRT